MSQTQVAACLDQCVCVCERVCVCVCRTFWQGRAPLGHRFASPFWSTFIKVARTCRSNARNVALGQPASVVLGPWHSRWFQPRVWRKYCLPDATGLASPSKEDLLPRSRETPVSRPNAATLLFLQRQYHPRERQRERIEFRTIRSPVSTARLFTRASKAAMSQQRIAGKRNPRQRIKICR
jgi:hypothetical protein